MQSPNKRAKGRFWAMIHQIFGLQVENPEVDVGAQSPDVTIKKIDGLVVLRDILTHGVVTWNDLVRMHAVYVEESVRRTADRMDKRDTPGERLKATPSLAARLPSSTAARSTGCGKTP